MQRCSPVAGLRTGILFKTKSQQENTIVNLPRTLPARLSPPGPRQSRGAIHTDHIGPYAVESSCSSAGSPQPRGQRVRFAVKHIAPSTHRSGSPRRDPDHVCSRRTRWSRKRSSAPAKSAGAVQSGPGVQTACRTRAEPRSCLVPVPRSLVRRRRLRSPHAARRQTTTYTLILARA